MAPGRLTVLGSTPGRQSRASICVLGSANMDLVVTVDRSPKPGETVIGHDFAQIPGGKGANQALAAARAGADVRMIGAVGDDVFGRRIRALLEADGIDVSGLLVLYESTGTAHIVVDGAGENSIVVVPGANGALTRFTDDHREAIRACEVLLLQLELPLSIVAEAIQWAADQGTRVVLTPAPVAPLPVDLLARVNLLVPNEHEATQLTGEGEPRTAAQALVSSGVGAVAVTLGPRGCVYSDGARVIEVPAVEVDAVDTTAAGDTFVGALTVALAEGHPERESLEWASAAAAISVQRPGASSSMPHRWEIDAASSRGRR
jgi:ribokinase